MTCTRCGEPITKKQPYSRTKKGPHHFKAKDCRRATIEHVETLWACACGHKWFEASHSQPVECPSCHIKRTDSNS